MELRTVIEEIKARVAIEEVIGRRVRLERRGARFLGLCPFHPEKTPSFNVHSERGFFKCFGCGKAGDVFTFLQEAEGLDFGEALRLLADEAGVELPRFGKREEDRPDLRKSMREALSRARNLYREALRKEPGGPAARYLAKRGLTPATVEAFGLGWAPRERGWLAAARGRAGFSEQVLTAAGLVLRAEGGGGLRDRFWERLIFPIADAAGRTVGFGGRCLPGSAAEERNMGKYINSPDGPLFPKRRLLYGLDRLSRALGEAPEAPILLCEGYLDVILLHQAGLTTAVAALGTALTGDHARRLRRFRRPLVLLLDPDRAGREAAVRGARIFVAEGVDVRVAELPEGKDPADLVAAGRGAEIRAEVARARDILQWRLGTWTRRSDFQIPGVRAQAAREMAAWIGMTPDPALGDLWVRTASDGLGVTEESLRRLAGQGRRVPTVPAGLAPTPAL
ncbi:MAG: DNA primase, partial [Planctomycetota bacterium]